MSKLRITMAQLNPTVGDITGNAQKVENIWSEYDDRSDLILFPEMFLCGYQCEDLVFNRAFNQSITDQIFEFCEQSKNRASAALIPTIYQDENKLYNAALLIEKGEIKHIFKKHKLPNYSVFDEKRTFVTGDLPEPYELKGCNLGIMICEDAWYPEVPMHLKEQNADLLISINASPFDYLKQNQRQNIFHEAVQKTGLNLIYLNMIGGQDELVFDGTSFIKHQNNEYGSFAYRFASFEEEVISVAVSSGKGKSQTFEITQESNKIHHESANFEEDLCDAITLGIEDYVHKNGFKDVIIGLSGGIDSALTATLAVDALGAEHVHCVMLPSEFTSQESLDDAKECAELLGVKYDIIPIKDALKAFENALPDLKGTAHENTQSRIRGTILMALSNMHGAMLLTTGNKSEMAVGYCTLYGDMNGGYNPLKDVYKTDVYKLAKWRNTVFLKTTPIEDRKAEDSSRVIPENIITKEPSAELREDQTDQDSLPPYDLLDDILFMLIECVHDQDSNDPNIQKKKKRCEENPETVEKIARLLKNAEFKRFQSPPGARISPCAFGSDRRYPMTNHFVNRIAKSE